MEFFRKFVKNAKNKRLISLLVILAAIPVTVFLARVSQELRERALGGPASLSILPSTQTKSVGEAGQASVYLDPGGANVSSVEVVITYDPGVIEVTNILPGPFFTDPAPSIGDPVVVTKDLGTPGQVHYALGFPLGSGFSSTATTDVAVIDFNGKGSGSTSLDFVVSGQPSTIVSNLNAQDVLGQVVSGTVNVSGGARLYFSGPTPPNPQAVSGTFTLDVMADTGGEQIDAVDARIVFDPGVLAVTAVSEGTEPAFVSFPALDFDNSVGTAIISANIGSGASPTPAQGSALHVGTLTFQAKVVSSSSLVNYDFTAGERNDSNMVKSGTWQTQDPVDILASVTSVDIVVGTGPTSTPTPSPTQTPPPPPPGNNPPSCKMISCPANGLVNQSITFNATGSDPDGDLSEVEIWSSPTFGEIWSNVADSCPGPDCSGSITYNSTGDYYVVCNAIDANNNRCTGNPFQIPDPAVDCGIEDECTISISTTLPTSTPSPSPTPIVTPTPTSTPPGEPTGTNVAPNATVSVSTEFSGNYVGENAVDGIIGVHATGEWASRGELNPWIQLDWSSPVAINFIRIYDRPNLNDHSEGGTLTFSDGSSINVSGIPNDGTVFDLPFTTRTVSSVRFDIIGAKAINNGLSEFEVFASSPISQNVTVKLGFEGRLRAGVSKRKIIGLFYRKAGETAVTTAIFTTNEDGEGTVDLAPGNYVFLFDADGYLARRFGDDANPVVIKAEQTSLDLSASPLLGGDFNDDGEVNEVDYTSNFLPSFLGSTEYIDLDGSGEVNNLDFAIMRANWSLVDDTL